jgi:hypothetical protein
MYHKLLSMVGLELGERRHMDFTVGEVECQNDGMKAPPVDS